MRTVEIPGMGGPSTPDREAAAAARAAQHDYVDSLTADPPSPEPNGHAVEAPFDMTKVPGPMTLDRPPSRIRPSTIEKVEMTFVPEDGVTIPGFKLTFKVSDICQRPHYISMLITDELGFQPSATMRFDLKFRGQLVPVIFMGAEFEFQSLGVRGISFLVDSKRQQRHDQTRQS
jgi:hypothetical protein